MTIKYLLENLSQSPSSAVFEASKSVREAISTDSRLAGMNFKFYSSRTSHDESVLRYAGSDELTQSTGELAVLCGRRILNTVARYPYRAKFTLLEVSIFNPLLLLSAVGLARRMNIGRKDPNAEIKFRGAIFFEGLRFRPFFLFENPNARVTNHFSISSDIGFGGFLNFLNDTGKQYSVLRFFEKLPEGNREGGDLDVLVADDLFNEASDFLLRNSGSQMIDMYSVSGPSNAARIPYHTPYLSQKILDEAAEFKGYSVPSARNYLNSFIYHCLYHKGLSAGIPTMYSELKISESPDNDYLAKIKELAAAVGEIPGETLEELDEYMLAAGWRPHTDTLELLTSGNKWIMRKLRDSPRASEVTLTACILKSGFYDANTAASFEAELERCGFGVLRKEDLSGERALLARNHLRGGNWSASGEESFFPKTVYILFDATKTGYAVRSFSAEYNPRPKKLKLRRCFDTGYQSHIHMTDDTHQCVEYIDIMYPGELENYMTALDAHDEKLHVSVGYRAWLATRHWVTARPLAVKDWLIRTVKRLV